MSRVRWLVYACSDGQALFDLSFDPGHSICWDKTNIVYEEEQWTKRRIKESFTIKAQTNHLNQDIGTSIDENFPQ